MTTLVSGAVTRPSGTIRQGITIDGVDVVIVAMSMADVDTWLARRLRRELGL